MSSHAPPAPPRVGVSFGGFDQSDFLAPREVGFHVRNHRTYGAHCAYHLLAAHAQLFLPALQLVGVTGAKRMRSGLPRLLLSSAMCSVLFSPAVGSLLDRACIGRRRPRNSPRATKVPRHCTHRTSSPHSVCLRCRIWRREGLKIPMKQPKRGRLWLNDGSCVRLRPERPNHVWSYDFVQDRTQDGRAFRMLVVLDEFTRRCLAIVVARRLRSDDVLQCLADLFVTHGPPEHIRSDNGPEFIAINVREWLGRIGVKTLYIEPGSPWENGYCESLNSKLRDELLNGEIFTTLREAQVLIENWRRHYNAIRPHSSLGYRPPAPEAILPPASGLPYAPLRPAQMLADHGRVLT